MDLTGVRFRLPPRGFPPARWTRWARGMWETLGQAAELSEGQLLALDRLGRGSLQEIKDAVRRAVSGKPPAKSLLEVIAEEDSAARAPRSPA